RPPPRRRPGPRPGGGRVGGGRGARLRLPAPAGAAAAGDRRGAPVPGAAARRRRHGEPAGAALPGDRRRRRLGPPPRLGPAAELLEPAPARLAPRSLRRPLRPADALLRGFLEGAAERLLLPRPLHRRLPAAAGGGVGPAALDLDAGRGRRRG